MKKMFNVATFRAVLCASVALLFPVCTYVTGNAKGLMTAQQPANETFINAAESRLRQKMRDSEEPFRQNIKARRVNIQQARNVIENYKITKAKLSQAVLEIQAARQAINRLVQARTQASIAYLNQLQIREGNCRRQEFDLDQRIQNLSQQLTNAEGEISRIEGAYIKLQEENAKQIVVWGYIVSEWKADRTQPNWLSVLRRLARLSREQQISCNVTINANPKDSIVIKYQREEEVQEYIANSSSVNLLMGYYHIWIERNGRPISNKNALYAISHQTQMISITGN